MIMFIMYKRHQLQVADKMREIRQINIKNRTYNFIMTIDIKNFDARLLKIDKKSYKDINMYYTGYITIKNNDECKNIHSVNPLYLRIDHANRYIEEKNGTKYLMFSSVDENKVLLKNTQMFRIKLRIKSKK